MSPRTPNALAGDASRPAPRCGEMPDLREYPKTGASRRRQLRPSGRAEPSPPWRLQVRHHRRRPRAAQEDTSPAPSSHRGDALCLTANSAGTTLHSRGTYGQGAKSRGTRGSSREVAAQTANLADTARPAPRWQAARPRRSAMRRRIGSMPSAGCRPSEASSIRGITSRPTGPLEPDQESSVRTGAHTARARSPQVWGASSSSSPKAASTATKSLP